MNVRSWFWAAAEGRPRSLWRLILFLLLAAAVANPLILLLDTTDNPLLEGSLENVMVALGFGVALLVAAKYLDKRPLKDYGFFAPGPWMKEFILGLLLGIAVLAVWYTAFAAAGRASVEAARHVSYVAVPFALAFAGQCLRYLAGSFFEELLSRGYLLRLFAEAFRARGASPNRAVWLSVLAGSAIFGALHLFGPEVSWPSLVNLILLSMGFALPVLLTGRLGCSIGLHMGWNVMQNNILGLPNGGKPSRASLWLTELQGPDWLTGGEVGPEGGLATTLLLLVALGMAFLWLQVRRKGWQKHLHTFSDPPPGTSSR